MTESIIFIFIWPLIIGCLNFSRELFPTYFINVTNMLNQSERIKGEQSQIIMINKLQVRQILNLKEVLRPTKQITASIVLYRFWEIIEDIICGINLFQCQQDEFLLWRLPNMGLVLPIDILGRYFCEWWSRGDSNPLPSECKSDVLPSELRPLTQYYLNLPKTVSLGKSPSII